jgi:hypothetical protein
MIKPCALCKRNFEDLHGVRYCSFLCRLFSKIDIREIDECWPYIPGGKHYGSIMLPDKRNVGIHTVIYEFLHGPLSPGMYACHSCDNKVCCNPSHLWEGTNQDNQMDASAKGRLAVGERNNLSKLTEEHVRIIHGMSFEIISCSDVADVLGVSSAAIQRVVRGESWKHIPGAKGFVGNNAAGHKNLQQTFQRRQYELFRTN